ncbi:sensor histidine kinase [Ferruginibacter albus]|uniref:sensor histidine kinase n=1 Tax=Ferruginibacter albus TaxID=2875540 RepID=UPI001CC70DBE|nr:ATP-binding protein [Ferruginibacter albus]UAY51555.1 GAF domain-containing protein [Ferruginibacter albus]
MTSEQLKLLVDTVQQLSMARSLTTIMQVVRKTARKLTGADGATFILRDGDLCYYADEDAIAPLWKGQRFPMSACISGWAMLNRKPAIIEDIYKDERIPVEAYRPTFVKSLAMVPIRTVNPVGAIGNYWSTEHATTKDELELLQSLADITSVSIENVYIYKELDDRVKQRTEQLEFANKELESFSYSVSHDLRAPLRAISGYTQILNEDYGKQLDKEGKRIMDNISNSTVRMTTLIDDLLVFSRLGQKTINRTSVNMYELVNMAIAELNKTVDHKAEINVNKLPVINADYNLMHQVIFNLISNAVKYSSKKGNARVDISCTEHETEYIFSVKDNGVGFDMKYANKLFGVFQRLHSNDEFEGTGVGLSLVQRIIYKHGGKIWADAKPDEGATFNFSVKKEESFLNN